MAARMTRLFSKTDRRQLSLVLSLILVLAGLPSAVGLVIVGSSQPEFTVNICQPLQAFNLTLNTLLVPPAPRVPEFLLLDFGPSPIAAPARSVDHRAAPDKPPPKIV
jgi:hypothetical protein